MRSERSFMQQVGLTKAGALGEHGVIKPLKLNWTLRTSVS